MSRRRNVPFGHEEHPEIQAAARRVRMTVAERVRQALRRARYHHPVSVEARLAAVAEATGHACPTPDIDIRLREIAVGQLSV